MCKRTVILVTVILLFIAFVNVATYIILKDKNDNSQNVEINRIKHVINEYEKENGVAADSLPALVSFTKAHNLQRDYDYLISIDSEEKSESNKLMNEISEEEMKYNISFYATDGYIYKICCREAGRRIDSSIRIRFFVMINTILFMAGALTVILYVRQQQVIVKPLKKMVDIPVEISKGNLVKALPETKNKYFGKFNWGMNMLRDTLEETKAKNLQLERDKKVLLMSLSHDIKTPLNAISLYSKAISKGLYSGDKVISSAESIQDKVFEIEDYMKRIVNASNEDIITFKIKKEEVYLDTIITSLKDYYHEKMKLLGVDFSIGKYRNLLLNTDPDRLIEVLQNVIENALKYGDNRKIWIEFMEEDMNGTKSGTGSGSRYTNGSDTGSGRISIKIYNTGCALEKRELANIFESFYRGTNTGKKEGSGLGLYICRRLMTLLEGEIYADIIPETEDGLSEKSDIMCITLELMY
ncbi:MAG: HAMP domain-containing histidine kinase [Eubacterium sp.]|nr:HAMP domain-containing histidine kinase [Eubacterium sp.]